MDDNKIVSLYWERSETAISETESKYGKLCVTVANNVLGSIPDAEECTNDAYLAVWNSIPPQRPEHFRAYLCRIVKNLALKKYEFLHAAKRSPGVQVSFDELEGVLADGSDPDRLLDSKELSARISAFLRMERKLNRVVFVRRYWFSDTVPQIAALTGMSENAVKALLSRMRARLKKYLEGQVNENE